MGRAMVYDPVRRKWIVMTPEEHVRQLMLQYMITELRYPASRIAVEKTIMIGTVKRRYDIVVYDQNTEPWLLAECKAPEVPVSEKTLHQLLAYQNVTRCKYWVLTNGPHTLCADASDTSNIRWMASFPAYDS